MQMHNVIKSLTPGKGKPSKPVESKARTELQLPAKAMWPLKDEDSDRDDRTALCIKFLRTGNY